MKFVCLPGQTIFIMERYRITSAYDGLKIGFTVARPKTAPKAVLQLVHGMCGCKERFEPVMEYMAANGVACIASDLRGHGESVRSLDDLGYMYKGGYKALISDLRLVSQWGHCEFSGLPYFLLGHSMGSLAARIFVKEDDSGLDGFIVCGSPSWNPLSVIGKWLTGAGCALGFGHSRPKFLHRMTSDRYNRKFAAEGPQSWTCSDPQVRKSFRENPLCNFSFTMNGAYNLLSMMGETYKSDQWSLSNPMMPVMFLAGSDDPCIISEQKFHRAAYAMHKAGYRNVTSVLYPDMRHEVLNEIDKKTVWKDILDFIEAENFVND